MRCLRQELPDTSSGDWPLDLRSSIVRRALRMMSQSTKELPAAGTARVTTLTAHRLWLIDNARALFAFFQRPSFNPAGGFFSLDENARPLAPMPGHKGANRQVHDTSRMVPAFAIAPLLRLPG